MKQKAILKSRHFGFADLLFSFSFICVVVSVSMNAPFPKEDILPGIISILAYYWLSYMIVMKIFYTILGATMATPPACKPWYWRRVVVYEDYVEVRYLFHRKWNYRVYWDDVDGYCIEHYSGKYGRYRGNFCRIYLQVDDQLWFYICYVEVSNFDTMHSVLSQYFGLECRRDDIVISEADLEAVSRGGSITLYGISQEEKAELRMLRRRRSQPRIPYQVPFYRSMIDFFTGNWSKVFLLIACVGVHIWLSPLLPELMSNRKTEETTKTKKMKKTTKTKKAEKTEETKKTLTVEDVVNIPREFSQPLRPYIPEKAPEQMTPYASWDAAFTLSERKAYQEAFPYMKHSAEHGFAKAQYGLGRMFEKGLGTPKDTAMAIYWYGLAAGQTADRYARVDAMNQLSRYYIRKGQYKKALAMINKALSIAPHELYLRNTRKVIQLYMSGDIEEAKRWEENGEKIDQLFMR